jgi:hypothetical protein
MDYVISPVCLWLDPMRSTLESPFSAVMVRRYRRFAGAAIQHSYKVKNRTLRAGFVAMASTWHARATEMEQLSSAEGGAAEGPSLSRQIL